MKPRFRQQRSVTADNVFMDDYDFENELEIYRVK